MHSSFDLKEAWTRAAQGHELALWKLRQEAPEFEVRLGFSLFLKKGKEIQTRLTREGVGWCTQLTPGTFCSDVNIYNLIGLLHGQRADCQGHPEHV